MLDEENIHVSKCYACINSLLQLESNDENKTYLLNETLSTANNPPPFSSQLNYLNDYTYLSIQSLVFLTLLPFGDGNVAYYNRNIYVTLTEFNRYLLKHSFHDQESDSHIYPFTKHNR